MAFTYRVGTANFVRKECFFESFNEALLEFRKDIKIPENILNENIREYLKSNTEEEITFFLSENYLFYDVDVLPMFRISDWWTIRKTIAP